MEVGYMGDIVFISSESRLLTPTKYERESTGRWAEHELLMRKPVSQYGGPGLEKLSFSIILDAGHGIDVQEQLKKLRTMRDTGAVFPLILGGKPVTQSYWRMDSIKETEHYWATDGKLIQCRADIALTEYNDSNEVEENSLESKYGKKPDDENGTTGGG